jgi:GNAT superfamily N-acetyltransferase
MTLEERGSTATTRLLAASDAEAMAGLRRRGYETDPLAFAGTLESDPTCGADFLRAKLATQTLASGSIVIGAFAPELVGLLGVVREEPGKFTHKARLWGFYVEPGARRDGVGRSLFEAGAAMARGWGVEQLTLRVCVACEAALSAYRRFGFEAFGREPRALKVGSSYFDELHMVALLGEAEGS